MEIKWSVKTAGESAKPNYRNKFKDFYQDQPAGDCSTEIDKWKFHLLG